MSNGSTGGELRPNGSSTVRIAKSTYHSKLLKRVLNLFGILLLVLFVLYLCFAATLIRVLPTATPAGAVPVKNFVSAGGVADPGDVVVFDRAKAQDETVLARLKQSFIPSSDVVVGRVVSGPFGKVNWMESGVTSVDGKVIDVRIFEKPTKKYLEDEYIIECLDGACDAGEGLILPSANIYGSPLEAKKQSETN